MEGSLKGQVVVTLFPYSDIEVRENSILATQYKKRPALVLADLQGADVIACMITSQKPNRNVMDFTSDSLVSGKLHKASFVVPEHIFALEKSRIERSIGNTKKEVFNSVIARLRQVFTEI